MNETAQKTKSDIRSWNINHVVTMTANKLAMMKIGPIQNLNCQASWSVLYHEMSNEQELIQNSWKFALSG